MRKQWLIICLLLPCMVWAQGKKLDSLQKQHYYPDEDTVPRLDMIDLFSDLFHIKSRNVPKRRGKVYYSLIPVPSTIPGGGNALITTTNAAFYLGPRRTTRLSNVSFSPSFSFSGRFSFAFHSNVWLEGNNRNIVGDMRFMVNPQYTWGLGKGGEGSKRELMDNNYFRFYQTFMRRIRPGLLAGLGYHLDWHSSISLPNNDSVTLPSYVKYDYGTMPHKQSVSSGVSLNVLNDTRANQVNPQSGYYVNAVFRLNPTFLGSNNNWASLYVDYRRYFHFGDERKQNVLALWGFYWTSLSSKTPYLDLPSIGWDPNNNSGRGINQNRFRGKGLIDLEAEYRRDILPNGFLGFTVFANMNTVTDAEHYRFTGFHPAGGVGLRIKFNKKSNTNIALDWGFSKYTNIVYIGLGEAF
ncbi:MAG TPA: hypothetical protein VFS25_19875 [Chitinophaga sp.]|uniref:BamA/TamA family outer membrane protein n=1 Tax=Chitinophaga sp. TaxID=1869181 RepID=UPI002DB5CFE7|nr:hypothetical protein [Chitinophaga sp.]HEU4555119.1 hypothetical protein [Chitinophaga sp.]